MLTSILQWQHAGTHAMYLDYIVFLRVLGHHLAKYYLMAFVR